MHNNPCRDVWNLVDKSCGLYTQFCKYYITGEQGIYLIEEQ